MYRAPEMSLWQGRVDKESTPALRWHQVISPWDGESLLQQAPVLLGFACDAGVTRNQGRAGARNGPIAIRKALANLAYHQSIAAIDAGDIVCEGDQLESAQDTLAEHVSHVLTNQGRLVVLGGGHEMAWGCFRGVSNYLARSVDNKRIGVINFDAHFDLRSPSPSANSGTAFRQMAEWHNQRNTRFNYLVLGINPAANTHALFDYAHANSVRWIEDINCTMPNLPVLADEVSRFIAQIDVLYLTVCLDVFPASDAPGVSAPSSLGVEPAVLISLIKTIRQHCQQHNVNWILSDIAELNPQYDVDNHTARLAARLVHELIA